MSDDNGAADRQTLRTLTLRLLGRRAADASICPSDVARALHPDDAAAWRARLPQVRDVAAELARAGRLRLTRGTRTLSPDTLGAGPIRLRRGPRFDTPDD